MLTLGLITFQSDKHGFERCFATCLRRLNSLSLSFCIRKTRILHQHLGLLQRLNKIRFEKALTEHLKM